MHLLFEEDGAFKAGTVLSGTDASFQVELPTGKRTKVKSSHVMLRFEQPAPAQLLKDAQQAAEEIDLDFLWECAPQDEFGFEDLAREYHGSAASPVQAASVLLLQLLLLSLALQRRQRRLQCFGRRGAVAAAPLAMEVHRG